jgi:mannose-1-phosphate guanylyltransferase/phosphomannomutase
MKTKVVIIAGGKGTRLKDIAGDIPKPMVTIAGKPILEHQIELAKRYGFTDIMILTGHLGEQIEEYFGDGSRFGVKITYSREKTPMGTAGCFKTIAARLTDDFFVFNGDTIMDVALDKMLGFHRSQSSIGTLFLHPNDHPYDSDLVDVSADGKITAFFPKPHKKGYFRNLVNAGLYLLSPNTLKYIERDCPSDFGKDIFPKLLAAGETLSGYISAEYIKDMGTKDRYAQVTEDVLSGKVRSWNKHNPRPAIFVDRDGVLNKDTDLLCDPKDLELLPGTAEALKKARAAGFLIVVVTNQPVIARNLCSLETLREIHNKLETLLGDEHTYVDAIYFCPHHPEKGFPGERPEYKIVCECRKPRPGMLLQAARDYNIDLTASYIIGDREPDILAGKNAGLMRTILVKSNGVDYIPAETTADVRTGTLLDAVNLIVAALN